MPTGNDELVLEKSQLPFASLTRALGARFAEYRACGTGGEFVLFLGRWSLPADPDPRDESGMQHAPRFPQLRPFSRSLVVAVLAAVLGGLGCSSGIDLAKQRLDARHAIEALRSGAFEQAEKEAAKLVKQDERNAYGRLVRAITRYKKAMHQFSQDARTMIFSVIRGNINHRYLRSSLDQMREALTAVDADLAASQQRDIYLELCLACWKVDWNHNGRIDRRDSMVFQIEVGADGKELPRDDPRRKPVFRFDVGDVAWARAFVNFQRAFFELLTAYKWTELDKLAFGLLRNRPPQEVVIRMADPQRVKQAKRFILAGLGFADAARKAYLAETDDDREWLPNPRQKNHPMPLPVDDALYETWKLLVGDLTRLVRGDEGLSVEALAQLGDHKWQVPPKGFIDVGRMLDKPRDIVLRIKEILPLMKAGKEGQQASNIEALLRNVLGDYYAQDMKASPITGRFERMKQEVKRGKESLQRKLRYLFWLN